MRRELQKVEIEYNEKINGVLIKLESREINDIEKSYTDRINQIDETIAKLSK